MEEKIKNVDLAIINRSFNNKTMQYYINNFAMACGMNELDTEPFVKTISKENKYRIITEVSHEDYELSDYKIGKVYGWYHDLSFKTAYSIPRIVNLDKHVYCIKFSMLLRKIVDNEKYELIIYRVGGIVIKHKIVFNKWDKDTKELNSFSFQSHTLYDEKIFNLIKMFVDDPNYTYDLYKVLTVKYKNRILERVDESDDTEKRKVLKENL